VTDSFALVVAKLWLRHKFGDYLSFCYGKYD